MNTVDSEGFHDAFIFSEGWWNPTVMWWFLIDDFLKVYILWIQLIYYIISDNIGQTTNYLNITITVDGFHIRGRARALDNGNCTRSNSDAAFRIPHIPTFPSQGSHSPVLVVNSLLAVCKQAVVIWYKSSQSESFSLSKSTHVHSCLIHREGDHIPPGSECII